MKRTVRDWSDVLWWDCLILFFAWPHQMFILSPLKSVQFGRHDDTQSQMKRTASEFLKDTFSIIPLYSIRYCSNNHNDHPPEENKPYSHIMYRPHSSEIMPKISTLSNFIRGINIAPVCTVNNSRNVVFLWNLKDSWIDFSGNELDEFWLYFGLQNPPTTWKLNAYIWRQVQTAEHGTHSFLWDLAVFLNS